MSLSEKVYETLKAEQKAGMKQTEIAAKHNVEQSHIQPILSGQRKAGKMRLETFDKMFPNASIRLYGDNNIMQTASNVRVKNGSVNSISVNPAVSTEQIRARIIAALIPLEIQPDALQTVLRTINELDLN